jgi:hypothetical protein
MKVSKRDDADASSLFISETDVYPGVLEWNPCKKGFISEIPGRITPATPRVTYFGLHEDLR